MAFYNYSTHGDASSGYVEIVVPIPFAETHSKYNDTDYGPENAVKGAELITGADTIPLMYVPRNLRGQFFALTKAKEKSAAHSSYLYFIPEPYKWGSLFQQDSLLSHSYNDIREIRYLDTSGSYKSFKNTGLKVLYFLDGKPVAKQSKEFFQKMKIELPPPVDIH